MPLRTILSRSFLAWICSLSEPIAPTYQNIQKYDL
jgi:hypothetical protein